jgi:hypothetical protein
MRAVARIHLAVMMGQVWCLGVTWLDDTKPAMALMMPSPLGCRSLMRKVFENSRLLGFVQVKYTTISPY